MADTVANTTLYDGTQRTVISSAFTIDGTEATVVLADKSAFVAQDGAEPSKWIIEKIVYAITGCQVLLEFDHDTDDEIATLSGEGEIDYTQEGKFMGFQDPASAGGSGDIIATTLNTDSGDTIHIILYLRKHN